MPPPGGRWWAQRTTVVAVESTAFTQSGWLVRTGTDEPVGNAWGGHRKAVDIGRPGGTVLA